MKRQWLLQAFCAGLAVLVFGVFPLAGQAKVVNGEVAFLRGERRGMTEMMHLFNPATNSTRQLLLTPVGSFFGPTTSQFDTPIRRKLAWSFDGRWLAYLSEPMWSNCELAAIAITPLESRCVISAGVLAQKIGQPSTILAFSWSPDNPHLLAFAYSQRTSSRSIQTVFATVNTEGKPQVNKLAAVSGVDIRQMEWSPDGHSLAFSVYKGFVRGAKKLSRLSKGVYLLDLASRKTIRFPGTKESDYAPTFSPDGSRLAVLGRAPDGKGTLGQVTLVDPTTATRTQITNDRLEKRDLEWSPDGASLLFSTVEIVEDESGLRQHINIVQPDGSGLRTLFSGRDDSQPTWQPVVVPDSPPSAE